MTITLNSPKIIAFFSKYPNLTPNEIGDLIVDIVEMVSRSIEHNADKSQLVSRIKELQSSVTDVKTSVKQNEVKTELLIKSIDSIQHTVDSVSQTISTVLLERFQIIKSEFLQDARNAMYTYNRDNHQQIQSLLEKNQSQLVKELESVIRSVIHPDSFDKISTNITSVLNGLHTSLQQDTNVILQQFIKHDEYKTKIEHFIATYKSELDTFAGTVNQHIASLSNQSTELNKSVSDLLARYNNSCDKGKTGEAELSNVLNKLFPSYEIINTSGSTATCDFIIKRTDKTSILIETKDYSQNVPNKEVEKFIRDTENNRMSGIFLSQSSGISTKPTWGVDMFGCFCRIYVHNVKYNPDTIFSAVQLLDSVEKILIQNDKKEAEEVSFSINKESADKINIEITNLIRNRNDLIYRLEQQTKSNVAAIRDLHVPHIHEIIMSIIGNKNSSIEYLSCIGCKKIFNNRSGLGSHYKGCKELTEEQKKELNVSKSKSTAKKTSKEVQQTSNSDEDKESE